MHEANRTGTQAPANLPNFAKTVRRARPEGSWHHRMLDALYA